MAEGPRRGEANDARFVGRLLFLLLLVYSASAGINECYELLNESLSGYVPLLQEPFLAPAASYWYRFSKAHHDAASMMMMEAPMADFAYGTLSTDPRAPCLSGVLLGN